MIKKTFGRVRNDVTRKKTVSENKKSLDNLTFQLCCVNKCKMKKRQTTKQKDMAGRVLTHN